MTARSSDAGAPDSGPHPALDTLRDFALGRLATAALAECASHLESCAICRQQVQDTPADPLVSLIQRAIPDEQRDSFRRAPPKYQVLEEIGRGGMAVVYRARQLDLDRIVALKQIRDDSLSAEELARFRAEPAFLAQIQHPNLVAVYDAGEYAGRPYLACEYIAGGSLDRYLTGNPLPVRGACRLLAAIARGVEAAHQRGFIHRDLKPSNVLLAWNSDHKALAGSEEFWTSVGPKVADLGLAKHLDVVHDHTQTGTVMGTPGYMSPEQTTGQSELLGRESDVFSLGVLMYELLTGRRPFQAATNWEVIELIRTAAPVAPRTWLPTIPRDLNVICLKCLEKDPRKRYAHAGQLAQDLECWLEARPIVARPPAPWERAQKWIYRHPSASSLMATIFLAVLALFSGMVWHNHRLAREVARANTNESAAVAEALRGYSAMYDMVKEITDDTIDTDDSQARLERLLEVMRAYHVRTLEGTDSVNPEVRFARASSQFFMGGIREAQGQLPEALDRLEQARQELRLIAHLVSDRVACRSRLAACLRRMAHTRFRITKQVDAATINDLREACDLLDELIRLQPQNNDFYSRRGSALHQLATMYYIQGRVADAEKAALEARAVQDALRRLGPLRNYERTMCATTAAFLARLRINEQDFEAADNLLCEGEQVLEPPGDQPRSSEMEAVLADLCDARCHLELTRGRPQQAWEQRTRSIELLQNILRTVPNHRFAQQFLPQYQAAQAEQQARLGPGDTDTLTPPADQHEVDAAALTAQVAEIRRQRLELRFDDAERELQIVESRLRALRHRADAVVWIQLLANLYFEWGELLIARGELDAALKQYDRSIACLNELAIHPEGRADVSESLANSHRLKAWHLSRAGWHNAAFLEWEAAIDGAREPTRSYLRAERALEYALLDDYVRASAEADEVLAAGRVNEHTSLHLARVYSRLLQAVPLAAHLTAQQRQSLTDNYTRQALRCLQAATGLDPVPAVLDRLDADESLRELRETPPYRQWRQTLNLDESAAAPPNPRSGGQESTSSSSPP
ncbi:MAG: serine/threonine protein kinase [Planctomycetes bacterium]|nr:serine/threonine protein kinase [Planctomycetota bacterium]